MPVLLQLQNKIHLGISNKLITFDLNSNKTLHLELPPIKIPENLSKGQEELLNETPDITTISASKDNTLIAVSTHNKQVIIYNTADLKEITNFILNRAASKICFDNENNLVVADKTGDAYLYNKGQEDQPILLLGHLSMLLDVVISKCGKYIITSDRDEKIRVSHYPNCYNIVCYCLGHDEFVTNIAICHDHLLSASGDGSLRLWDFKTGKCILKVDTNTSFKQDASMLESFRDMMDKDHIEVNAIPISDMQVWTLPNKNFLICITLINSNNIALYHFKYREQTINHVQIIDLCKYSKIVSFSLSEKLIILTVDNLICFNFIDGQFVLSTQVDIFNDQFKEILLDYKMSVKDVLVLYKRKFDNVQEYLERKKQRMENK